MHNMTQAEENALRAGRTRVADGAGGWPSWNHVEFRVRYPSLANQLCVAGIYVKLLLDGLDQVTYCPKLIMTLSFCSVLVKTDMAALLL
jgi:hypothetical protein